MSGDDLPGHDPGARIRTILVDEALTGERLDKALALAAVDLSRMEIQRLIKSGAVTHAGQPVRSPRERVQGPGRYRLALPETVPAEMCAEAIPLKIIFEDDHLIVIDKAAGMTVHPGAGQSRGTLVNALLHHCRESLSGIGGVARPGIVHRLDKETSGLLVAAKHDAAHRHLAAQFKAHSARRRYLAVLKGIPVQPRGCVDAPLARHPVSRRKMAVVPPFRERGRRAVTHYALLERLHPFCLVSCRLETGRTHQIRVHMAHLGHPLLGDPLYARPFNPPSSWPEAVRGVVSGFRRQALHAASLTFEHPASGMTMRFKAALPEDFSVLLEALRALTASVG